MAQKISKSQIDWAPFTFNMKTASTTSNAGLSNGANYNLGANGASIQFTVVGTAQALVTVSVATISASDFENKPLIYVNGSVVSTAGYSAAAGNSSSRVNPRTWQYAVTLSEGVNTISAGVLVTSATSPSVPSGGAQVSAVVLGNVTA